MRCCPVLVFFVITAGLGLTRAQNDGYWSAGGSGSWASAGDWLDGTIADGTDSTAYFGISLYPINSSATFTLDGARTIGNISYTTQTTPATWSLNTGAGGPLTLDTTFDLPSVTVSPNGLQLTLNTVIAGVAGLEKLGGGTLVLTATNLYTGGTALSAGTLLVNGRLAAPDAVTVASGTILGGTGIIYGPVIVQAGGVLSPGGSPGSLTISNSLTLQSGSKTWMDVNAATLAHDSVPGITSVNYGGTLTISNLAGSPTPGQTFPIFSAASASGNFSAIAPQLTGSLRWQFDPAAGVLSVIQTNSHPGFAGISLTGKTNLLMLVTNGVPGATNYLLTSTNLTLPETNWARLATNVFDAGGNCTFSNGVSATMPQRFYLLP